ncbi:MAG: HAD family hydrolase [Candidatus Hodarchaeota archaeon]
MTNKARAVIFDLDGTLIDSMSGFFNMVIEGLDRKGIRSTDRIISRIGTDLMEDYQLKSSKQRIGLIFKLFWKIGRKAGLSRPKTLIFTIECVTKARKVYYSAPLFPDVIESLTELHSAGFHLGVCTIASRKELMRILEKYDLTRFFNPKGLISRNDVKKIKPDPEGLLLALKGCSVSPSNGTFLGDMPADIIAGTRAGVTTIGLTTGLVSRKIFLQHSQPVMIFNSLKQASKWILQTQLSEEVTMLDPNTNYSDIQ